MADEYQGVSGFFTVTATDYYICTTQYAGHLSGCPYAGISFRGTTSGNPELKPITATVSGAGIAWTPLDTLQLTFDYLHWKITNEVQAQDTDQLLRTDSACLLGQLDITSPTCVDAVSR